LTYLKEERKKDGKGERNRRKKDKTHTPCIAYTGKEKIKASKTGIVRLAFCKPLLKLIKSFNCTEALFLSLLICF
jgi:hypothetical protein